MRSSSALPAQAEVELHRAADDLADAVLGVQRGVGHLVDHLRLAQLVLGAAAVVGRQRLAVEARSRPAPAAAGR